MLKKPTVYFALLILLSLMAIVIPFWYVFTKFDFPSTIESFETYSGIISQISGPLLSFVGVLGVVMAIWVQLGELNETRNEMRLSTEALQKQQEEKTREIEIALRNSKKEDLFRMIEFLNADINSILEKEIGHPLHSGLDVSIKELVLSSIDDVRVLNNLDHSLLGELQRLKKQLEMVVDYSRQYDKLSDSKIYDVEQDKFEKLILALNRSTNEN